MDGFRFTVLAKDKKTNARVGEIRTTHGTIKTPAFVPVGTQASVKSLTPEEIKESGTQLFFVNTYHMYLRPGIEVVEKLGGLHKFMGWDGMGQSLPTPEGFRCFLWGGVILLKSPMTKQYEMDITKQEFTEDVRPWDVSCIEASMAL